MQKSYGIYDGLKIPAKAYKCCLVHLIKSKEDKYPESLSKASSKEDDSQKNSVQLAQSVNFPTHPFVFVKKIGGLRNQSYKIGGKAPPPDTLANASSILSLPEII